MVFSSRGIAFASILEIFVVEEDGNVDAAARFSAIGDDAASADSDDTSAREAKTVVVALESSTRGLSSAAIASVNYKIPL